MSRAPIEVFISYAHKDEELCNELLKHIALLRRSGLISAWHDRDISAGADWKGTVDSHLESASIILLLVSSDFVNSDYCYDEEMKRALELHASGQKCVIPIILRPCDWQDAPFGKLQGLPKDCKPVTTWDTQDEAFLDIVRGIKTTISKLVSTYSSQVENSFATPIEIDFTKLETLLSANDFVEANEESIRLLKQIFESTKDKDGKLSWNATPCDPLRKLDNLWLKCSKGHFGLGVQNRIWRTIPIEEHPPDRWKRVANFGIHLEWLDKNELDRDWGFFSLLEEDKLRWKGTSEAWNRLWSTSNIKELPQGYLPYLPLLSFNCRTRLGIENVPWARWCHDFYNLIKACKL